MDVKEIVINKKLVVGIKIFTSNANESNPETALIPSLWQRFFSENIAEQIQNKLDESNLLGVYTEYDDEHRGHYSVIVGQQVSALENISEEFVSLEILAGRYLIFSEAGDMPAVIFSLWQKIWDYFSDNKNHQRAFTTDFELYSNDSPSKIDIYVALKES